MEGDTEAGYHSLRETVEKYLNHSGYSVINLTELFSGFMVRSKGPHTVPESSRQTFTMIEEENEEDYF